MIIYYILKTLLLTLYSRNSFYKTDVYKGYKLYAKTSKKERKSIFIVMYEIEKLAIYWKCFPDTYFRFGMFLKSYTNYELMKTFLPQVAYSKLAISVDHEYDILINDKILFNNIMTYFELPTTHHYFVWKNNQFYKGSAIISDNEVDCIISEINEKRVFVKRYRGGAANGIFIFSKKNGGYYDENDNKLTALFIRNNYNDSNYLFEKQIMQESVLRQLNPDTVNTIRVLTKDDKIVSASVRVGRKGAFVDNAAKGGIVLSLDIETGIISDYGLREYDIKKYYEHPDTGLLFKNTFVPQWEDVRNLVLRTLVLFPYFKSVGFDIATTDEGPIIIEINTGAGVYASQMGKVRGIADKFV